MFDENDDEQVQKKLSEFLTKDTFAMAIERMVIDEDMTYFEAVIAFCEENDWEYTEAVKMMYPNLLEKVKAAAVSAGYNYERVSTITDFD